MDDIYQGRISFLNNEKHFGFISIKNNGSYFFTTQTFEQSLLKKQGLIDRVRSFSVGDEVQFKVRPSENKRGKFVAYEIIFLGNDKRQKLIDQFLSGDKMLGYLKKFQDKFFVKHLETYVFVQIIISGWETDLQNIYEGRIDKIVEFRLVDYKKIEKITGVLKDRKFIDEYHQIVDFFTKGTVVEALITGKNADGFFTTTFNGKAPGFIPYYNKMSSIQKETFLSLKIHDIVQTKISHISNNQLKLVLLE